MRPLLSAATCVPVVFEDGGRVVVYEVTFDRDSAPRLGPRKSRVRWIPEYGTASSKAGRWTCWPCAQNTTGINRCKHLQRVWLEEKKERPVLTIPYPHEIIWPKCSRKTALNIRVRHYWAMWRRMNQTMEEHTCRRCGVVQQRVNWANN